MFEISVPSMEPEENSAELLEKESNTDMASWLWNVKVFYAVFTLWNLNRAITRRSISRRRRPVGRKLTRLHNSQENRDKYSWYNTIIKEAAISDHYVFFNITRMTPTTFEHLLRRLGAVQSLVKRDTKLRKSIPLGNEITFTLVDIYLSYLFEKELDWPLLYVI